MYRVRMIISGIILHDDLEPVYMLVEGEQKDKKAPAQLLERGLFLLQLGQFKSCHLIPSGNIYG